MKPQQLAEKDPIGSFDVLSTTPLNESFHVDRVAVDVDLDDWIGL